MSTPAQVEDALASIYDAGAVRTPPWMAVVAALGSVRPGSIGEMVDWLVAHRGRLEAAYAAGASAKIAVARLPAELQRSPELGGLDRTRDDHALRDRHLFADLVGQRSFTQSAVYAITGKELSHAHAEMLDAFGAANLLVDPRAWPMAVTRRAASRDSTYAEAVLAGQAMLGGTVVAGAAAGNCARFLRQVREEVAAGRRVSDVVADVFARRERVMGFGRPAVGPDERVPIVEQLLRRYERHDLPCVKLLREIEDAFAAQRGLRTTAAAWAAAILGDFDMTPTQVEAVSNYWVSVCVAAQAAFTLETTPSPSR